MVAQWRRNVNEKRLDKIAEGEEYPYMKYKSYQIVKTWQQTSNTFDQNANETKYNTSSNILLALVVRTDDFRMVSCTRVQSER